MSPHFPFRLENIFTKSKDIDIIGLKCTQTSSVTKSCDSLAKTPVLYFSLCANPENKIILCQSGKQIIFVSRQPLGLFLNDLRFTNSKCGVRGSGSTFDFRISTTLNKFCHPFIPSKRYFKEEKIFRDLNYAVMVKSAISLSPLDVACFYEAKFNNYLHQ